MLEEAQRVTDQKERARLIVELQERIGDALLKDGSLAEAQIAFELAASSASPRREADLYVKLAATGVRRGNPRSVLEVTRIVLEQPGLTAASRASAEALAALSLASQAQFRRLWNERTAASSCWWIAPIRAPSGWRISRRVAFTFWPAASKEAGDELQLSIASREQAAEHSAVAESQLLLGLVQCQLGELDAAEASIRRALTLSGRADRWTRANAGLCSGVCSDIGARCPEPTGICGTPWDRPTSRAPEGWR